jgi:hypothetical protein
MRRQLSLAAAAAALFASPALAEQSEASASVEDFVLGCTAALMAPADGFANYLATSGFAKAAETSLQPTIDVTAYDKSGTARGLIINRQRFSDAIVTNCQVSGSFPSSEDDVRALRAKLEAQPLVAKLDGEVYKVPQATILASFKRPGSDPVLTVNVTAGAQITLLTMTRWDFKAGR